MSRRNYVNGRDVPWPEEWQNAPQARTADYRCECHGSLWLVYPLNAGAHQHLVEHVGSEAQWFGDALVVESRYINELIAGLKDAGFTVMP
jgi:hypothetical protein